LSTTFQPPSKSLTARDYQFITLVAALSVIVCSLLVLANRTIIKKGGGEFYVLWVGSRAFLVDKIEPYGGEVAAHTQILVYAGPAKPGDKPYILDTPFHILLLYFPFSLLSDPLFARALFTLLLELSLFALAALSLHLSDWEGSRPFYIFFIIFAGINFYAFQAIYNANPVLLLGLACAGILFSLRNHMDELCGALIAISLYRWEVSGLFLLFVILRVYFEKRTGVFAGFFMTSVLLLTISYLAYPGWTIPFLRASFNNWHFEFGLNIQTVIEHFFPAIGHSLAWIIIISLGLFLGYECYMTKEIDSRRFYWVSCLSLASAPLLGFRTEMGNLSILVIPLALIFSIVNDRWRRFGGGISIAFMLSAIAVPWLIYLYLQDKFGSKAQDLIFLFWPILFIVGLYWIRWWALRPPRTWLDLANPIKNLN
jgi:hypothetical protein